MRAPDFIRDRARTMRRTLTLHEKQLWYLLRRNQLGLHFRRQHPIGPFILDFYCPEAKLCVEVDGPLHDEQHDYDQRRTDWLTNEGIRVLRFSVEELEMRQAVVLATIAQAAPPLHRLNGGPPPPQAGEDRRLRPLKSVDLGLHL